MHFAYVGFTHQSGRRCFQFREVDAVEPVTLLTIEVEVALLSKNKMSVQEAPLFCLRMLESAHTSAKEVSDEFRPYQIVQEDFRSLNAERVRRETELRFRKHTSKRRPAPSVLPTSLFGAQVKNAV